MKNREIRAKEAFKIKYKLNVDYSFEDVLDENTSIVTVVESGIIEPPNRTWWYIDDQLDRAVELESEEANRFIYIELWM